jgi:hypothetical protein
MDVRSRGMSANAGRTLSARGLRGAIGTFGVARRKSGADIILEYSGFGLNKGAL